MAKVVKSRLEIVQGEEREEGEECFVRAGLERIALP
jgi:hypothetical protein